VTKWLLFASVIPLFTIIILQIGLRLIYFENDRW